ncbi:hypothetical protein ASF10_20090 [Flavobacterium sp. Leaf82]|nr:hypothetical protein ASF10_20090 [Flavobacterium sp. Leaf82]
MKIGKNGYLYILIIKKNAFKNWSNSNILDQSKFESVSVFKGDFGTTIIYKSTSFSFKNSSTGNL